MNIAKIRQFRCMSLVLVLGACGSDSGGDDTGTPDSSIGDSTVSANLRAEVLAALGKNVIAPALDDFEVAVAGLPTALADLSELEAARESGRASWLAAMRSWQRVEMMQVGPIGAMDATSGGEDARDNIYAWPLRNLCAIDQRTVSDDYNNRAVLREDLVSARGMGAIAYLLFAESTDNHCSPLSPINAEGVWETFSSDEIVKRRTEMGAELAALVSENAAALVERFSTDGGNFLQEFEQPTRSGALYGSAQEGLNAVSDAMFYLDKETKDMKVAEPAGILGCEAATCPEAVEFPFAKNSTEAIEENLRAFELLYRGGDNADQPGFDDLLIAMGAEAFAQSMATHIDDAIAAVGRIDGPLAEAVTNDLADVEAAHEAIRLVTDDLKTMFLSVLDLEVPNRAAGDND